MTVVLAFTQPLGTNDYDVTVRHTSLWPRLHYFQYYERPLKGVNEFFLRRLILAS